MGELPRILVIIHGMTGKVITVPAPSVYLISELDSRSIRSRPFDQILAVVIKKVIILCQPCPFKHGTDSFSFIGVHLHKKRGNVISDDSFKPLLLFTPGLIIVHSRQNVNAEVFLGIQHSFPEDLHCFNQIVIWSESKEESRFPALFHAESLLIKSAERAVHINIKPFQIVYPPSEFYVLLPFLTLLEHLHRNLKAEICNFIAVLVVSKKDPIRLIEMGIPV